MMNYIWNTAEIRLHMDKSNIYFSNGKINFPVRFLTFFLNEQQVGYLIRNIFPCTSFRNDGDILSEDIVFYGLRFLSSIDVSFVVISMFCYEFLFHVFCLLRCWVQMHMLVSMALVRWKLKESACLVFLLRQVVWVMPLTLGDDTPVFLHSFFLFEGPQLCLISISSTMKFSIYFRYISVSELHVL